MTATTATAAATTTTADATATATTPTAAAATPTAAATAMLLHHKADSTNLKLQLELVGSHPCTHAHM